MQKRKNQTSPADELSLDVGGPGLANLHGIHQTVQVVLRLRK